MSNCDTCKWWSDHESEYSGANMPPPHKRCLCPKIDEPNYGEDDMGYDYNEGGRMHTGPKFGCIHHEVTCICETNCDGSRRANKNCLQHGVDALARDILRAGVFK